MVSMDRTIPGAPTSRTTVKRHADRAEYDQETIRSIVDEALYCHVSVVVDGSPRIIPTIHARVGDVLYIHGSNASRTLRAMKERSEACIAITLLDGLVLARSAFNHSMNYRSVLIYGPLREVDDPEEKWEAQRALVEHIIPGRAEDTRMPDDKELRQTTIMAISLDEASAKVRAGPPIDDPADLRDPRWAGVIPLSLSVGEPVRDERVPEGTATPPYVTGYRRGGGR